MREANFLGRPYSKDCDSKYNARSHRADTKHKRSHAQDNVRSNSKSSKFCVSPQFRAIGPPNPTRGFIQQKQNARLATAACHPKCQNARFATAACAKMYEMSAWRRQSPAAYKNHRFTTVSDIRPARSDEMVARTTQESCISPQFWTSNEHETTRGLPDRARREFAFHHSFGRPTITFCVTWMNCGFAIFARG